MWNLRHSCDFRPQPGASDSRGDASLVARSAGFASLLPAGTPLAAWRGTGTENLYLKHSGTGRRRREAAIAIAFALWFAAGTHALGGAPDAQDTAASPSTTAPESRRSIRRLEAIEFDGLAPDRWGRATRRLALTLEASIDAEALATAAARLEATGFYESVEVSARPGSTPDHLIAVFHLKERGPDLRFGAGHEALSGWYLVPAELSLDNLTGREERLRLGARIGYRVSGLNAQVGQEILGGGRWELTGSGDAVSQVYFNQRVEVIQEVQRARLEFAIRAPVGAGFQLTGSVAQERARVDSTAQVYQDDELSGAEAGDTIGFEDLPPAVADDVRDESVLELGLGLTWDRRRGADLTARGSRGSIRAEWVRARTADFPRVSLDLRGYRPLSSGLALAGRISFTGVAADAPFHRRPYLGGLTSVRGFPSHSLSPAGGDLGVVAGSAELRAPWVGEGDRPRLAALAFVDLGGGWNRTRDATDRIHLASGVGLRCRVPLMQYLGLDVGFPLTPSPVRETFHVNLSLGWNY
ncbi:MAG: BamA/TamA family outer membrane protein [Candidatus Eisenbacteria bacterium]|nr:BamA/TamA family outer membrane protein [Candidatus Eisenbacteria bacterium]